MLGLYLCSHLLIFQLNINGANFQMTTDKFPVLSSLMTCHEICNWSNKTGATSGAGTAYLSGAPEFTLGEFTAGF
jgi:hypothetical protein